MNIDNCGCGRPGRYMTPVGMACNKYSRCATYDELESRLRYVESLLLAYRAKRSVDGLNGRPWDASKHFKAESQIEALEHSNSGIQRRQRRPLE